MKRKIARALKKITLKKIISGTFLASLTLGGNHTFAEPITEPDPSDPRYNLELRELEREKYEHTLEESVQLFNPVLQSYIRDIPLFEFLDRDHEDCEGIVAKRRSSPYDHIIYCQNGIEDYLSKNDLDTPTHEYLHSMGDIHEVRYNVLHDYVERWLNDPKWGDPSRDPQKGNTMKKQIRHRLYDKNEETGTYTYSKPDEPGSEDFCEIMAYIVSFREEQERERLLKELPKPIVEFYRHIIKDEILDLRYKPDSTNASN